MILDDESICSGCRYHESRTYPEGSWDEWKDSLKIADGRVREGIVDDDPVVQGAFVKFTNGVSGIITSAGGKNVRVACTRGEIAIVGDGSWLEMRKPAANRMSPYYLSTTMIQSEPTMSGRQGAIEILRNNTLRAVETDMMVDDALQGQRILFGLVLSELHHGEKFALAGVDGGFTVTGRFGNLYA